MKHEHRPTVWIQSKNRHFFFKDLHKPIEFRLIVGVLNVLHDFYTSFTYNIAVPPFNVNDSHFFMVLIQNNVLFVDFIKFFWSMQEILEGNCDICTQKIKSERICLFIIG